MKITHAIEGFADMLSVVTEPHAGKRLRKAMARKLTSSSSSLSYSFSPSSSSTSLVPSPSCMSLTPSMGGRGGEAGDEEEDKHEEEDEVETITKKRVRFEVDTEEDGFGDDETIQTTTTTRPTPAWAYPRDADSSDSDGIERTVSTTLPLPPPVKETVLCLIKPASEMTDDEKAEIWWQDDDFARFQTAATFIAQEIKRLDLEGSEESEDAAAASAAAAAAAAAAASSVGYYSPLGPGSPPTYTLVIAHALEACRFAASASSVYRRMSRESFINGDYDDDCHNAGGGGGGGGGGGNNDNNRLARAPTYDAYDPLPKTVSAYLAHWSAVGHSRRGLEKWSVPLRRVRFEQDRDLTCRAVLEAQEEARRRRLMYAFNPSSSSASASASASASGGRRRLSLTTTMMTMMSDDGADGAPTASLHGNGVGYHYDDDELVSIASRRCSRSARMFALAMGAADAAALGYKSHVDAWDHNDDDDDVTNNDNSATMRRRMSSTIVSTRRKVVSSAA